MLMSSSPKRFVVLKRGFYYRPDFKGFTGILAEAGRFSLDEVATLTNINTTMEEEGLSYALVDDTPLIAPAALEEVTANLQNEIDDLKNQLARERLLNQAKVALAGPYAYHVCYAHLGGIAGATMVLTTPWDHDTAAKVAKTIESAIGIPGVSIVNFNLLASPPKEALDKVRLQ
jgi:hypothetical protein